MTETQKRADPLTDIDVTSGFAPARPRLDVVRAASDEAGFPSRLAKPLRRRRTGRNYQLSLKVKPEAATRFAAMADAKELGFGEFLEHMLEVYAGVDVAARKQGVSPAAWLHVAAGECPEGRR
jgi:hypothetical protein